MTIYTCPKCLKKIESTTVEIETTFVGDYNIDTEEYDMDSKWPFDNNETIRHYCPECEEQIDITSLIEEEEK